MGHFWTHFGTPFLTPFGRSGLGIPADAHMFWAILARTCQKGGPKRGQKWGQKWPFLGSKMTHFGTPFLTPILRFWPKPSNLSLISRDFGLGPAQDLAKSGQKRGQKWVKKGSKMTHFGVKNGPFLDPLFDPFFQVGANRDLILRGFGTGPVKRGSKRGSKMGSKMGHF